MTAASGAVDAPPAERAGGALTLPACRAALTILVTATAVLAPLALILYQSFLTAPFFDARKTAGLDAYAFIFADPDFWQAFLNSFLIASGMTLIAVPLGALLAFVMERTDLPGKRWVEPLILVPSFVSPMVLSFGYVVAAGPGRLLHGVGDASSSAARRGASTRCPRWRVIAGLTHVPNVYVYASSALKSLGSDVEEAARVAGASPLARRDDGEPAADHAVAAVRGGAGVLPRLRAVRPAAGARRPRRPSWCCRRTSTSSPTSSARRPTT